MTPLRFRKKALDFYAKNGRDFPWRRTTDPYKILVSEIMLQQTQTSRVVPKYQAFLKTFPTLRSLAKAPVSEVLKLWQGLGYNRRALMLHRAAQYKLPNTYAELLELPGIGPYTASAVMVFAHNKPQMMIETNIRAALIHEFFPLSSRGTRRGISDLELLPILKKAVPPKNARVFYQALMDYGAFLKQKHPNPSRRSAHHAKQSKFEGSDRQIRGQVLRLLSVESLPENELMKRISGNHERQERILSALVKEGFITKRENKKTPGCQDFALAVALRHERHAIKD